MVESKIAPRYWWLLPAALALVVGLITIDGEFVYDDSRAVVGNPIVTGDVPWLEAFQRDFWGGQLDEGSGTYRPLPPLLWRCIWSVFPGRPLPFRLLSLILHLLATIALYRVGRILGVERSLVMVACLIFAVHGAHAEAVGGIVSHADLLGAVLGLTALALALAAPGLRSGGFAALLLLVAVFVKESAVVFAGAAILGVVLDERHPFRERMRTIVPILLVALSAILVHVLLERPALHWGNGSTVCYSGSPTSPGPCGSVSFHTAWPPITDMAP